MPGQLGEHKRYKDPKKILLAAHELLSVYGRWTKGTWVSFGPGTVGTWNKALDPKEASAGCKFCPEGAIYACSLDQHAADQAIDLVTAEMRRQGFEEETIPDLNDKGRTTKKTMLNLLEDAARA